jgi:hypothetical protein
MRAVWPLLAALFLCGAFLGAVLPRIALGVAGAGLLSAALFLVWAARDGLNGIEGYFKGARGEEWVAALLATLPSGYHVFHDVARPTLGFDRKKAAGPNHHMVDSALFAARHIVEHVVPGGQRREQRGNPLLAARPLEVALDPVQPVASGPDQKQRGRQQAGARHA